MQYSKWTQGKRAIRKMPLPLLGIPAPFAGDVPELKDPPTPPMVGLRVLVPQESCEILEFAQIFAEERGVKDAKPGHPLYDFGIALKTVEIACVDPDTNPDNPAPFFDGGVSQILAAKDIGTDGVIFLAECQRNWQALCAPQAETVTEEQLRKSVEILAGPEESAYRFFELCGPALQWNLARSMASLLRILPTLSLLRSLSSEESGESSNSSPEISKTNSPADDPAGAP